MVILILLVKRELKFLLLAFNVFFIADGYSQLNKNNVGIQIINDNLGEISNKLKTGNDYGETQSTGISINLLTIHHIFNYHLYIESTEFSAPTKKYRHIHFKELNNFKFVVNNNKSKDRTSFISLGTGLYYIQGNSITIGASGQKYYFHKLIISKDYPRKYWIYENDSSNKLYLPYLDFNIGYNYSLFKKHFFRINSRYNIDIPVSTVKCFTGIAAISKFVFQYINENNRLNSIDLEAEGYYFYASDYSKVAYVQVGLKINFRHFSAYFQLNKPFNKQLKNPYLKYDDLDVLFIEGLTLNF